MGESLSAFRRLAAGVFAGTCLAVLAFAGQSAPSAEPCPLSQGYWKNHAETWPRHSLVLGDAGNAAHTYTQSELLHLLNTAAKGDASLILAYQLIAARLNVASGSNPAPVANILADADGFLAAFSGKLPYGVKSSTSSGQKMVTAADVLDRYNNGQLAGSCGTPNRPPTADAGSDQTTVLRSVVTLNGSASTDADGDTLSFDWSFLARPAGSTA